MKAQEEKLQHWIDRAFWTLITGVAIYMASQLKEVSSSVNELNIKLSVYIAKSDAQTLMIQDHENRVRKLEERKK